MGNCKKAPKSGQNVPKMSQKLYKMLKNPSKWLYNCTIS